MLHINTSGVVLPVTFFSLLFLTSALNPVSSATLQNTGILKSQAAARAGSGTAKAAVLS